MGGVDGGDSLDEDYFQLDNKPLTFFTQLFLDEKKMKVNFTVSIQANFIMRVVLSNTYVMYALVALVAFLIFNYLKHLNKSLEWVE